MSYPTDFNEILEFARVLIAADWLSTPAEVADYFERPSKWAPEYEVWTASGTPNPPDPGWRLFQGRLERDRPTRSD